MFRFFNKNLRKTQSNILERNGDCVIYRYLIRGMLPENDHYLKVKGYYISDEYALRYEAGYYHIDHIPTSRCISELNAFDYRREDAINEARRIAGLPEIHLTIPEHFFRRDGATVEYTYHSSTGGKWIVSGTYISDEYAVRQSIKGYHVDHIPSGRNVLTKARFDDAIHEAKVKAGFLPLMDEQRVAEAEKIILPKETKERLQNSIAEGYYFAFDTHFLVQQHQEMKYLLLADNREIFISKRVYEELDSKETVLILNKFSNENRLNIFIQEPDQPFLRSHRFFRKHDDLIVASYLHYMLSKEKKILLCTNDVGMKMLATSVEIPVFTC